ncbi:MAG: hypothetical protein AVDCRST_MAG05-5046, partial [uncultured Rubrobacteraceae bacterium]
VWLGATRRALCGALGWDGHGAYGVRARAYQHAALALRVRAQGGRGAYDLFLDLHKHRGGEGLLAGGAASARRRHVRAFGGRGRGRGGGAEAGGPGVHPAGRRRRGGVLGAASCQGGAAAGGGDTVGAGRGGGDERGALDRHGARGAAHRAAALVPGVAQGGVQEHQRAVLSRDELCRAHRAVGAWPDRGRRYLALLAPHPSRHRWQGPRYLPAEALLRRGLPGLQPRHGHPDRRSGRRYGALGAGRL